MPEHHDTQTMERLRERLARADSELEAAQHFLDPNSVEGDEIYLVRAIANARASVNDALATLQFRADKSRP